VESESSEVVLLDPPPQAGEERSASSVPGHLVKVGASPCELLSKRHRLDGPILHACAPIVDVVHLIETLDIERLIPSLERQPEAELAAMKIDYAGAEVFSVGGCRSNREAQPAKFVNKLLLSGQAVIVHESQPLWHGKPKRARHVAMLLR
jgi:hypothetical protein